jgi:hypothetical protein
VFDQWWTNAYGTTGPDGRYSIRGFQGESVIEVRTGDKLKRLPATLSAGGGNLEVVLN